MIRFKKNRACQNSRSCNNGLSNETSRRQKAQRVIADKGDVHKIYQHNFVIITAANPNGSSLLTRHNMKLNKELEDKLTHSYRIRFKKVIGKYNGIEESFICYDLSVANACKIAKDYEQESFIVGYRLKDGRMRYDLYTHDEQWNFTQSDECYEVHDVTDETNYFTQLCRKFKFKMPFPSFESRKYRWTQKYHRDEDEPLHIILSDSEIEYYKERANNTGLMPLQRRLAKNMLKRHDETLGIRPPKECY